MDQNAQAHVLKALLRQRELLDKQIQEIVDGLIRSTPQQQTAPAKPAVKRRRISAAAKKRMAEATRKRWEQYRQAKAAGAKKTAARKSSATAKAAAV